MRAALDHQVGAERAAGVDLAGRARHRDARADRLGDLDRGGADTRRAGVDERPPPARQAALHDERVPCREEHLGDRRRVRGSRSRRGSAAPGGCASRRARRSTRPTRSPSRGRRSPSSSRARRAPATVPAYSRPRISTSRRTGSGYPPMRCNVSARLHALCVTRTRISSGPGTGSSTSASVRTSGPPYVGMVTARTPSASRGVSARRSVEGPAQSRVSAAVGASASRRVRGRRRARRTARPDAPAMNTRSR